MAEFGFVSGDDFRRSLEADYRELEGALAANAWKAVHVLAGSVIEAILIDYIAARKVSGVKDPLKLELSEAIGIAHSQGAISDRAAGLSHVIRGYRNLIHPGRLVRLKESVDENSATVAKALVDMIIGEMSRSTEKDVGTTAEQLVTKLAGDSSALPILGHLVDGLKRGELRRLVLTVLPEAYLAETGGEITDWVYADSLGSCYRMALHRGDDKLRTEAANAIASVIRVESGPVVAAYEGGFLRGPDIGFMDPDNARLVTDHVLAQLEAELTSDRLKAAQGMGPYLTTNQLKKAVHFAARAIVGSRGHEIQEAASALIRDLFGQTDPPGREAVLKQLEFWIDWLAEHNREDDAGRMRALAAELDIPF